MTRISQEGIYILICIGVIMFVIMMCLIKCFIEDYLIYQRIRRRRNRIVPIEVLMRMRQERLNREATERYVIETENYNKVMRELKNKIIVINPDDTMYLGISQNSSSHD